MKKLKEIFEERAGLKKQMDDIADKASTEKRALTKEEATQIDQMIEKSFELKKEEERAAKMAEIASELHAPIDPVNDPKGETKEERAAKTSKAFRTFLLGGKESMSDEDRSYYNPKFVQDNEKRATTDPQSVTTTAGGYLVPTVLQDALIQALKLYGGAKDMADVFQTASGNPIDFATIDDTANKGRLLGINTQVTVNQLVFGKKTMYAFKFSSDEILIPTELLQDAKVDINAYIADLVATRIGRIENDYFTTGTGSGSQPEGCLAGATDSGLTSISASALTKANLIDLMYTVDPLYRRSNKCAWMFNDLTAKALFKLSLGTNIDVPLFASAWTMTGNTGGLADKILGYSYVINQSMPNIGAGLKPVLFGDFGRFKVREAAEFRLLRLTERYADYDQIAIIALHRADSAVMTSAALKYLKCGNT